MQNLGAYVKCCVTGSLRNSDQMLPDSAGTDAIIHDIKTPWNLCFSVRKTASHTGVSQQSGFGGEGSLGSFFSALPSAHSSP